VRISRCGKVFIVIVLAKGTEMLTRISLVFLSFEEKFFTSVRR
jgi:hypothetical protein